MAAERSSSVAGSAGRIVSALRTETAVTGDRLSRGTRLPGAVRDVSLPRSTLETRPNVDGANPAIGADARAGV